MSTQKELPMQTTASRQVVPPDNATAPVVVSSSAIARAPLVSSSTQSSGLTQRGRAQVHVAPNLRDLVTAPSLTPKAVQAAKEQRDLNEIVHTVLIAGLVVSTALMLIGIGLDLAYRREIPTAVPSFDDVFGRVIALRPSGFLALGLLVLVATPILRVVGSIGAFIYERDWRYAAVTGLVLGVLVTSLLLGKG